VRDASAAESCFLVARATCSRLPRALPDLTFHGAYQNTDVGVRLGLLEDSHRFQLFFGHSSLTLLQRLVSAPVMRGELPAHFCFLAAFARSHLLIADELSNALVSGGGNGVDA
jgi:hypothetical protein